MPGPRIKTRREEKAPPITRREHGGAFLPLSVPSSDRCRATHDVPYTLRCTLNRMHIGTANHVDKEGNTW